MSSLEDLEAKYGPKFLAGELTNVTIRDMMITLVLAALTRLIEEGEHDAERHKKSLEDQIKRFGKDYTKWDDPLAVMHLFYMAQNLAEMMSMYLGAGDKAIATFADFLRRRGGG